MVGGICGFASTLALSTTRMKQHHRMALSATASPFMNDDYWREYKFSMTINGKSITSTETSPVICPITGELLASCPVASSNAHHLESAVEGASKSFSSWKQSSFQERRDVMSCMSEILKRNADELGSLLHLENGKPLPDAIREAGTRTVDSLLGFSQMTIPIETLVWNESQKVEIHRRPLGVVGCILPWNFPLHTLFQKIAPAIYAGNSVVVKPSEFTPLSTLRAMELVKDAIPPGLIQTVAGGSELGREMCAHPSIRGVSFTGSTRTGASVARNAMRSMKRVALELGGNDAAIVLPDANAVEVARGLAKAAFANGGQVCHALKRLYVHEWIHDEMCVALAEECKRLKANVDYGPLTTRAQLEYVRELVEDAVAKGGTVVCGGNDCDALGRGSGFYYAPTLVTNVQEHVHRIVNEEQFGPILPILKFSDPYDALSSVNSSEMGLTGSVWTKDEELGYRLASGLESGTAFVNHMSSSHGTTSSVDWPSQGWKMSGMGSNRGLLGLLQYTQPQTVNQRFLQKIHT